jgi:hypothetical protein
MLGKMEILKWVAATIVILSAVTTSVQGQKDITADTDVEAAREVKDYYADWLSSIPGVSSVRVANSDQGLPEIVVDARQMTPQLKQIPTTLNGIPVVIQPLRQAEGESLSSEPLGQRGYMPSPTPEVEISPVPTPQANPLFPDWMRTLRSP